VAGDEHDGAEPSKSQLDKLGHRLREGLTAEKDLRALDDYRRSFRKSYEAVEAALRHLQVEKFGRPAKTTLSIVEKLNRQKIRLTQIQDIAGIRLVCGDAPDQDLLVIHISQLFPGVHIDDRRVMPSHGYRAVHFIVTGEDGRFVEIQLRTKAQHQWAEVSEKPKCGI
jgi:GTP pyrophosphokinase